MLQVLTQLQTPTVRRNLALCPAPLSHRMQMKTHADENQPT